MTSHFLCPKKCTEGLRYLWRFWDWKVFGMTWDMTITKLHSFENVASLGLLSLLSKNIYFPPYVDRPTTKHLRIQRFITI